MKYSPQSPPTPPKPEDLWKNATAEQIFELLIPGYRTEKNQ